MPWRQAIRTRDGIEATRKEKAMQTLQYFQVAGVTALYYVRGHHRRRTPVGQEPLIWPLTPLTRLRHAPQVDWVLDIKVLHGFLVPEEGQKAHRNWFLMSASCVA